MQYIILFCFDEYHHDERAEKMHTRDECVNYKNALDRRDKRE